LIYSIRYTCHPENNTCVPICGDGNLTSPPEECDPIGGSPGCIDCKVVANWTCPKNKCSPICGDGILIGYDKDFGEKCDNSGVGCENCKQRDGYTSHTNICNNYDHFSFSISPPHNNKKKIVILF
jgi:hypothetical protein